jgi:hypothetical protein
MTNPDFVLLAKAMGVHAIRCTSRADLPAAMKEFLEYPTDKPILLECCVERTEHVYPMVSLLYRITSSDGTAFLTSHYLQVVAGNALHEVLLHPRLGSNPPKK